MTSSHRRIILPLKVLIILTLLLAPFAAVDLSARAAPAQQGKLPPPEPVVLKQVQTPEGVQTTLQIYASEDAFISSANPNNNYGGSTSPAPGLGIGYSVSNPTMGAMRLLIKYILISIPSNAVINSATAYLYETSYWPQPDSAMGVQAQLAVSSWSESNVNWNNANFIGGSPLPVGNINAAYGWQSFNATNVVSLWVSGSEPNYGVIVTGDESPTNDRSRYFATSESANKPYIIVTYTTGGPCDNVAPTSSINPLPTYSPNSFTVSWSGTDYAPSGCAPSGVASYIIWYQVNNGSFVKWIDGTTLTSAVFNASGFGIGNGATVGFRSQAIDYAGNKQPAGNATASTIINTTPPTVSMNPLPAWTNVTAFTVSWTGNTQGGPSIQGYDLQVSVSGGAWQTLLSNTPQTSFQYQNAQDNTNYAFQVRARNVAGTVGNYSSPTGTTVDLTPPTASINALPQFTNATSFWVSWSGSDATSGIEYYNVQYQLNGGSWQTLIGYTPQTSFNVQSAQTGQLWGFRVQAVDNAGNVQPWPANAQASTTVFANPIAIVHPFNPAILQSTALVTSSFPVTWTGIAPPGSYISTTTVLYSFNYGPYTKWDDFPGLHTGIVTTSAIFTWTLGDGVYQFKATAASSNPNQPPLDLPQYAQTIIVDMADAYQVRAYLPIIMNNAQP